MRPLTRRSGVWIEPYSTAITFGIPTEALSLTANALKTSPAFVQVPVANFVLNTNAPTYELTYPLEYTIPAIPLTLAQNTFSLVYEFTIPNAALSLTAHSPGLAIFALHTTTYRFLAQAVHRTTYEMPPATQVHETTWTLTTQALHTQTYQSIVKIEAQQTHEARWASVGLAAVSALHTTGWVSIGTDSAFTSHACSWRSLPLAYNVQEAAYQAITGALAEHRANYASTDTLVPWATHEARWRSFSLDAQTTLANAYIEPDIQLLEAQVTADEDSPYYQCEVTLRNPKDYQRFTRDQAFVLHLLNESYHFVVDTKGLNRSIDDQGNYIEVATIGGLSPLCLQAAPRSMPITKTWDTPTYVSAIVQELIGSVTWNLVDWQLPAFRLAVENADPFDVAQQIVNAAGGLIESQPDGSVVVRHRWPISIAELDAYPVDATMYEDSIYSAQESPTNDDLINAIRITDNATYQDRLEYVPNTIGDEDDPWNGILYAFPSPWREGLTIATTRGSQIQIGLQYEGTRTIVDTNDDYPAETLTFEAGTSSTAYPIQSLLSVDWLDENLGGLTYSAYATTVEASAPGNYYGYSLAKVAYTTRYLAVPVACRPSTETIEAQFLLLETS